MYEFRIEYNRVLFAKKKEALYEEPVRAVQQKALEAEKMLYGNIP